MDTSGTLRVWVVDVSEHGALRVPSLSSGGEVMKRVAATLLPRDEAVVVGKYLRAIDQARCLAGKLAVRLALLEALNDTATASPASAKAWSALKFARKLGGKPYLSSPSPSLPFNITHDGDWVAVALHTSTSTRVEIGIDVMELSLPHFEQDVQSFVETMDMALTAAEQKWVLSALDQSGNPQQQETLCRLYDLWTHKEAYTKAFGVGLGFDFAQVECRFWECSVDDAKDANTKRSTRRAREPILFKSGKVEPSYAFTEIALPCGQAAVEARLRGEGTGKPSQLVIAQGPLDQDSRNRQVLPRMAMEDARREGWLRVLSLQELVDAALRAGEHQPDSSTS